MRKILKVLSLSVLPLIFGAAISGCGSGGGGEETPTSIEGRITDVSGAPVPNVSAYIFETHEGSRTDDTGAFSISSFKQLRSAKFFIEISPSRFSDTVDIGSIPAGTEIVRIQFSLDTSADRLSVVRVDFDSNGEPVQPTPGPVETPVPGSTPRPTPTPRPGNFDINGNTTAFGIPAGLSGNITEGRGVWVRVCLECHASAERSNRTYGQIKAALASIPSMQPLRVSNQSVADVTAYLNRNKR